MMLSTSIVWDRRGMMINRTVNGGNPNPTGCGGGLNWVAAVCNPKSGTYPNLTHQVAMSEGERACFIVRSVLSVCYNTCHTQTRARNLDPMHLQVRLRSKPC